MSIGNRTAEQSLQVALNRITALEDALKIFVKDCRQASEFAFVYGCFHCDCNLHVENHDPSCPVTTATALLEAP